MTCFTVLFIGSVCLFGLCKGQINSRQRLEFEIAKMTEEIVYVSRDICGLRQETNQLVAICVDKINMNNRFISSSSDEIKAQLMTLQYLYKQLAKSYAEEDRLKEAPADVERLKLGIKVVLEDIQTLQKRREDGTAKSCLELVDMTANSSEVGPPSALSRMRLCYTPIDLENQLRLLRCNLEEASHVRAGLYRKLECTRYRCNKMVQALMDMIEKLGTDRSKVQERISQIRKELEEQNKRVSELINSSGACKNELEEWNMKETKKVLNKYQQYALEVYSYNELVYSVKTLVLLSS